MRSLGSALGMSHMAVYHHFPGGREELIQVTTDSVVAQIRLPEPRSDWITWILDLAENAFTTLSRFPGVAEQILTRHPVYVTSSVVGLIDAIMGALLDAGLDEAQAAEVWTVSETWLAGQLWITDATRNRPSTTRADLSDALGDSAVSAANLLRVAEQLAGEVASTHLRSGLHDLLVGFRARMARND